MKTPGDADVVVRGRAALLDALDALSEHRRAVVLVGAQAIYLHTSSVPTGLAATTKDSDLALDTRFLGNSPTVDAAMLAAGFHLDLTTNQPGAWLSADGMPIDIMVPEALAGGRGSRGMTVQPHSRQSARRAVGLEAAVVDNAVLDIAALDPTDPRVIGVAVAGPAALLVAKLHKLGKRQQQAPYRLSDKDAHDVYRLLSAFETAGLVKTLRLVSDDELAGDVTREAMDVLGDLFAGGESAVGSMMAGRAEELVGDPQFVSQAVAVLAQDPGRHSRPERRPGSRCASVSAWSPVGKSGSSGSGSSRVPMLHGNRPGDVPPSTSAVRYRRHDQAFTVRSPARTAAHDHAV